MRRLLLASLVVAAAACGGASGSSTATGPHAGPHAGAHGDHAGHHGGGDHEHPPLTAELDAFHDRLAPAWHHDGADRRDVACGASGELVGLSADVAAADPAPGADPAAWDAAEARLTAATEQLQVACAGTGDVEPAFAEVHDAFHAIMGLVPGAAHP